MAETVNQAHFDGAGVPTMLGVVGTLGTADVGGTARTLPLGVNPLTGGAFVHDISGAVVPYWTSINITYPTGTTEVYVYNLGTSPIGTVSLTYSDSSKGSLTTVVKS